MKLISLNIELNKHYDTVLDFLKRETPDVICLQELLEDDFSRFKKELNMEAIFKVFSYFKNDPYYQDIEGKRQGVAIFAKNIVVSGALFYVGNEENLLKSKEEYLSNEEFKKNRVLLWVDVKDKEGEIYRFSNTHFPVTKKGESSLYQLEVADKLLEKIMGLEEFVLCGDTNAPRGNETFSRLAKKLKDNIPLVYKTSIDQNLHKVKGIQFMVDALFTTPAYKALNVKLIDGVSDHMAVVAEISKN
jgi:exonuclease III